MPIFSVENMCGDGFFSCPSLRQPPKVILKHGQELEEEQEELAEHQPLEQEDLNFERWKRRPLPKRTLHQKIDDVKTYLWNAETNEFMGRSGKSWSEFTECDSVLLLPVYAFVCGGDGGGGWGCWVGYLNWCKCICAACVTLKSEICSEMHSGNNVEGRRNASGALRLGSLCCECVSLCSVFT